MTDCKNCDGIGYIAIRGDDTDDCKICEGTGEAPVSEQIAVNEPLGDIARLRIDLNTFDEIVPTMHPESTDAEWERFTDAQDKLYADVDGNLHMLFDAYDALLRENAELRGKLS